MFQRHFTSLMLLAMLSSLATAQGSVDTPRPTPLTRPEMKKLLEDVKFRQPRIPLPQLTEADRQALGDRADNYEARLRYHYLDHQQSRSPIATRSTASNARATRSRARKREPDPNMTLDHGFKVELFWIVSRTNNCHYCLGHQETKLLAAGRSEDRIASLDGNWDEFAPAERAAFTFARKFTYQPHLVGTADIESLRPHFTDLQIIEMVLSMAWNNSINRWKEAVGVPQNPEEGGYSRVEPHVMGAIGSGGDSERVIRGTYVTPTSAPFQNQITRVASIAMDASTGEPTAATVCTRPTLESRAEVMEQFQRCRQRSPRLPLASAEKTRKLMSLDEGSAIPNWLRLLAHFPVEGVRRGRDILEATEGENLSPTLKAQLSWIVARYDRSWYMLAHARQQLRAAGASDDEVFALDGDWTGFTDRERALFRVAKNLAASPVVLTEREVTRAVGLAGPAEVVQAIHLVTQLTALSRITEAAGLPIE